MMWFLRRGLFRPFGPVGLAFTAYRLWRRVPPARKAELRRQAREATRRIKQRVAG
jgi:hypothetical protein